MSKLLSVFVVTLVLALPSPARAEWTLSPFVGGQAGGDAAHGNTGVGVSGGWMSGRWLGAEADFSWAPEFFVQNGITTERQVITFMGNAVVAIPNPKRDMFQPYVSGGLGLIRPDLSEPFGTYALTGMNQFAGDIGGGATVYFNRSVGVRGDVRYFHGLGKENSDGSEFGLDMANFHFWRTSIGLAVRF